ncbi:MAG: adenylate/guanylate cyclase domain-containing protein [Sandaracinaceae bacterium]|nr:adenylate/guanylate cyclase domain-containing protein [Sandaracinaceae bacterium]
MSEARIRELEAEVARWRREHALGEAIDERLELALRERQPIERVMPSLLDLLIEHAGATGAAVQTLDESLSERVFLQGEATVDEALLGADDGVVETASGVALVHCLDVAGEPFGRAFLFFPVQPGDEARSLLTRFAEEVDNHLAAIAQARRKYEVFRSVSDALKDPVLGRGLTRACEILQRQIDFDDLVLVFRHEDSLEGGALRYRIHLDGELVHRGGDVRDPELDHFVRQHAAAFLDGDDAPIRDRFGIRRYREEVLITGVRSARVIGRMLATSRQGEFHTYDRELLDRFADYLRQRIVDFNREWKQLSVIFDGETVARLLREEDYHERWLTPRDREVAILYADITGFTRVSEQILKTPEAIGHLVDTWSDRVVSAIWHHRGVFDKMVGDCVIGHFGPPFFDMSPQQACRTALDVALEIREITRRLVDDASLGLPVDAPLDVAVGLHFCPVSVGFFGPNDDYTAFSSGMNNTARLQGIAEGGEILCMQPFVDALGEPERFGEASTAEVKNVADPLVFRPLLE